MKKDIDFKANDRFPMADAELLKGMEGKFLTPNEEEFFYNMVWKEVYEWAGCCDVILSEFDNEEEIYIVRYFDSEYKIGKGRVVHQRIRGGYFDDLRAALNLDMYALLQEHITLLEWLRRRDYAGVRYDNNTEY